MSWFRKLRRPAVPDRPNLILSKPEANRAAACARTPFDDSWIMPVSHQSESMGDHVRVPCYAVIQKRWETLRVGDVVLRLANHRTLIHMASYHDGNGNWRTTGLANHRTDDGWMNESTYLVTVLLTVPYQPEDHTK
jgi:hypothetical protein